MEIKMIKNGTSSLRSKKGKNKTFVLAAEKSPRAQSAGNIFKLSPHSWTNRQPIRADRLRSATLLERAEGLDCTTHLHAATQTDGGKMEKKNQDQLHHPTRLFGRGPCKREYF